MTYETGLGILSLFIIIYGLITAVALLVLLLMHVNGYHGVALKDIWKLKRINWFGKTLATIGFFLAAPWWAIVDVFIMLMTIGVNKNENENEKGTK